MPPKKKKPAVQKQAPANPLVDLEERVGAASNAELISALRVLLEEGRVRAWRYVEAADESEGVADDGVVFVTKLEGVIADADYGDHDGRLFRGIHQAARAAKEAAVAYA